MNPIAAVEQFVAAWNRRDRAAIRAALHPDVVCQGMPLAPARGAEAAMAMLEPFLAADAIDWRIERIAVRGRTVFTERIDRFRFAGRPWTAVRAAGVMELDQARLIVAWRDYFDMAELVAALPPA